MQAVKKWKVESGKLKISVSAAPTYLNGGRQIAALALCLPTDVIARERSDRGNLKTTACKQASQ
ncbi:MAG: hypothetical protein J6J43_06795 [Oscillospiraceae bacterium]|nr:hypothetical protein [Oscillospiraceae bacterium]